MLQEDIKIFQFRLLVTKLVRKMCIGWVLERKSVRCVEILGGNFFFGGGGSVCTLGRECLGGDKSSLDSFLKLRWRRWEFNFSSSGDAAWNLNARNR